MMLSGSILMDTLDEKGREFLDRKLGRDGEEEGDDISSVGRI